MMGLEIKLNCSIEPTPPVSFVRTRRSTTVTKSFTCIVTHSSAEVSLSNRYTALYNHKFLNKFKNSKGVN